jgi:hypothetical protein
MPPRRTKHAVGLTVAALALNASCGTHVLVGKAERQESTSTPGDAGSGGATAHADPDAGEIVCGNSVCATRDLGVGLGLGPPCCYAVTSCGASFSNVCVELDSPGMPDTNCAAAGPYPGCCRPDGTCGISATGTAFGCVNPFAFFPTMVLGTCTYGEPRDAAP